MACDKANQAKSRLASTRHAGYSKEMNALARHRVYVTSDLATSGVVGLERDQTHYLINVLRLESGDRVIVFNGRDGEFEAEITAVQKKSVDLTLLNCLRPQEEVPDLMLAFAPVKRARIDYIAEKATELGVGIIQPMMTEFTVMSRVNSDRLMANAVEAAEQTGRITLPDIREPVSFSRLLEDWPASRHIVFCDEKQAGSHPHAMADQVADLSGPAAIFIGPEGGFSPLERDKLNAMENAIPVSLGANILRADTAMVAALSVWQAVAGAWRNAHGST